MGVHVPPESLFKLPRNTHPRYGYPTLHHMLKTEGCVINRERTYRIYREEGLQVRTKSALVDGFHVRSTRQRAALADSQCR
jgi:hypothetical protein